MGLLDSAIGAIGSIAGGFAGQAAGAGDRGEARNAAIVASEILQKLEQVPDISKPLVLEQYRQAGILTPEMEQYVTAQMPQSITTDPRLKEAQLNALKKFQDRSEQGLTSADRAALAEARAGANRDVTSRLASIDQQMQARGMADSGSALAAKLSAAQAGANRMSSDANQLAQQSQIAALQAAAQSAGLGSQMENQEFNQKFNQQQAADQMQRFNIQNQIAQQQRNVANSNNAQMINLQNQQNINNMNTQQSNQEQYNQLSRQMQEWNAKADRARMQAGAYQGLAGTLQKSGDAAAQGAYNQWAGAGQALGGVASALGDFNFAPKQSGTPGSDAGYGRHTTRINPNAKEGDYAALNQGGQVHNFKQGGHVPGVANVPGDSIQNDTVPAMLSPGEIVVPRTLSESKFGKHLLKLIDAHNNLKKHMNGDE